MCFSCDDVAGFIECTLSRLRAENADDFFNKDDEVGFFILGAAPVDPPTAYGSLEDFQKAVQDLHDLVTRTPYGAGAGCPSADHQGFSDPKNARLYVNGADFWSLNSGNRKRARKANNQNSYDRRVRYAWDKAMRNP